MAYLPRIFTATPGPPEALQRALDTDGEAFGNAVNSQQPVVVARDLTDHQYLKLGGINTYGGGGTCPAAAGAQSIATLRNPPGSGLIVTVRRAIIGNTAATQSMWWGVLSSAVVPAVLNPVVITPFPRDTRQINPATGVPRASGVGFVLGTTLGAPPIVELMVVVAASPSVVVPMEMTVAPGGWFFIIAGAVNTLFACSIAWEERSAQTSELNIAG